MPPAHLLGVLSDAEISEVLRPQTAAAGRGREHGDSTRCVICTRGAAQLAFDRAAHRSDACVRDLRRKRRRARVRCIELHTYAVGGGLMGAATATRARPYRSRHAHRARRRRRSRRGTWRAAPSSTRCGPATPSSSRPKDAQRGRDQRDAANRRDRAWDGGANARDRYRRVGVAGRGLAQVHLRLYNRYLTYLPSPISRATFASSLYWATSPPLEGAPPDLSRHRTRATSPLARRPMPRDMRLQPRLGGAHDDLVGAVRAPLGAEERGGARRAPPGWAAARPRHDEVARERRHAKALGEGVDGVVPRRLHANEGEAPQHAHRGAAVVRRLASATHARQLFCRRAYCRIASRYGAPSVPIASRHTRRMQPSTSETASGRHRPHGRPVSMRLEQPPTQCA